MRFEEVKKMCNETIHISKEIDSVYHDVYGLLLQILLDYLLDEEQKKWFLEQEIEIKEIISDISVQIDEIKPCLCIIKARLGTLMDIHKKCCDKIDEDNINWKGGGNKNE